MLFRSVPSHDNDKGYSINHPNVLSDGDNKGKNEIGSSDDINARIDNTGRNIYNKDNGYSSVHPNALSNGDDKGKGEYDNNVGSLTDINTRIESVSRNKYGNNKTYPDF